MGEINVLKSRLSEAEAYVRRQLGEYQPTVGLILGSGLGPLADAIEDPVYISFEHVPHMKRSTASSHVGRFVCGMLGGKCVLAMQGRLHGYEGYAAEDIAFPVWLMHLLGIHTLITTNAAGAINAEYNVGDFCIMKDHINFTGRNPIADQDPNDIAFRFFSMIDAYDPELRAVAVRLADELDITVHEGVYLGLLGPSFETPAEIRAFRAWGADTVAMSVVEEVIAARHVGMRVFGMSLCSNMAAGMVENTPYAVEDEVFETAEAKAEDFSRLLTALVAEMGEPEK